MKKWILVCVVIAAAGLFYGRSLIKSAADYLLPSRLPKPSAYTDVQNREALPAIPLPGETSDASDIPIVSTSSSATEPGEVLIDQNQVTIGINLAVPFQAQAPFGDWVEPYKEGCEEASLIMVDHYVRGVSLSKQEMKDEIDAQVAWQREEFGGHYDIPIKRVSELADAIYDYTIDTFPISEKNILRELQRGRPVIVPSAGRELGNPNFRQPGPLYHMLVIKGVSEDGMYITNDPGTRNGADYLYEPAVLFSAIRDWDGDSPDGESIGLVMYK